MVYDDEVNMHFWEARSCIHRLALGNRVNITGLVVSPGHTYIYKLLIAAT